MVIVNQPASPDPVGDVPYDPVGDVPYDPGGDLPYDPGGDLPYASPSMLVSISAPLHRSYSFNLGTQMYISLQIERNTGRLLSGPDQDVTVTSLTTTLSQGLYSTTLSKARIGVELLFLIGTIIYLLKDLDTCFLAYQQFGSEFMGVQRCEQSVHWDGSAPYTPAPISHCSDSERYFHSPGFSTQIGPSST